MKISHNCLVHTLLLLLVYLSVDFLFLKIIGIHPNKVRFMFHSTAFLSRISLYLCMNIILHASLGVLDHAFLK